MKKKIAMAFLLVMLAATPVYAAEVQDFGTAGNVSVQQQPNDNGGSDDWIVVNPGESGRGIKIVDENGKAVVSVDRYGGVYVDGKLYVNGKEYKEDDSMKAAFTPINGFLYVAVIFSLLLNLIRFSKKG
ncbi:hypothetical protein HMPREF9623_01260 [Stomatobaculum longum]|uniref:Uncharacterized protein n=1 Tax=Stomatobaculum longum TaxID=796942 RepID=A0AA36Y4I3_9FIRM|nr:hypothetical protein [Stomatobaculum longum]EHO16561.1 hypothetical protein HMPREF9623_01260 [Stomatobaculum longum]